MVVMTAKVSKCKMIAVVCILAAVICGAWMLLRGEESGVQDAALDLGTDEGRIAFLKTYGWEVAETPVEVQEVRIPEESSEIFEKYNALQRSQGFDLTGFAGKQVKRYVYQVTNHANGVSPVYATLLICKNAVIGGDITATDGSGLMHGFSAPEGTQLTPESAPRTQEAAPAAPAEEPAAPLDGESGDAAEEAAPLIS